MTSLPGATLVVSGSEAKEVVVWDLRTKKIVQRIPGRPDAAAPGDGHCDAVLCVAAHPLQPLLASGALEKDCTVRLWAPAGAK